MPQIIVIPLDGQEIGQGYNSHTGESVGTGLSVASVSKNPAVNGQEVTTICESVTSQESLMESFGISASLDVRYGLFTGGAKFKFAENHAVNSFSSFIAVRCVVHNAIWHGQGFQLTPDANALSTARRMDEFKTAFGDMFVRSIKTGGEFDVVVRITSVSDAHQSKMAASLLATYKGLAAIRDFETAFNTAVKETNSQTEVTAFMIPVDGVGTQASFTGSDAAKILDRLSQFPQSVHDHPVGFEAELANYNTIPIPVPTAEEREDRDIVLKDCFAQKMGFLKALSDLQLLLGENASLFFDNLPSQEQLLNIQGQYRTALNDLMAHAIKISTGKMDPPKTFVANPSPPPLNFKKKPFGLKIDGVWRPDDNDFDVSQLDIVSTGPGQANVVVTFRHGKNAPIVKSTTATLDVNTNTYRSPVIIKQTIIRAFGKALFDTHKVAFSNEIVGNKTFVTQTVVPPGLTGATSDLNLTSVFTRLLLVTLTPN